MPRKLLKYQGWVNRITWFTQFNYALKNGYSTDVENWTPPDKSSSLNANLKFISSSYFMANIDWGDGNVEQFQAQKVGSDYRVVFRSMRTELSDYNAPFGYATVPPHHYADDDAGKMRTVTVEFTGDIENIQTYMNKFAKCPVLEFPALKEFNWRNSSIPEAIPFDFFKNIPLLEELILSQFTTKKDSVFPESLFSMTQLSNLQVENCFMVTDIESSRIRRISELKNLEHLYLSGNRIVNYLKEFNDLPKLYDLRMRNSSPYPVNGVNSEDFPVMEADFNPKIKYLGLYYSEVNTAWGKHLENYDMSHISVFLVQYCRNLPWDDMPDFFRNMRSLSEFNVIESLDIQSDADQFFGSMYRLATEWEYITYSATASDGERNQFYNLSIKYREGSNNHYNLLPTGSYQAPDGFVKGSSNGNPSTPMEKLYVLKNNYNMKFDGISDADLEATVKMGGV